MASQVLTCCFTLGFAIGSLVIYLNNVSNAQDIDDCPAETISTLLLSWSICDFLSVLFSFCVLGSAFFENCLQIGKNRKRRLDDDINQYASITFLGLKGLSFVGSLGILCYLTWLLFAGDCDGVNDALFISTTIIVVCEWFAISVVACCLLCTLVGLLGYLIFIGLTATNLQSTRFFANTDEPRKEKGSTIGSVILDGHHRHEEQQKLLEENKEKKKKIKKVYTPYQKHFISGTNIPDPLKH